MDWEENKFMENRLIDLSEMDKLKGKLYAGYILALDGDGHIRADVYKRGDSFVCFLHHAVASMGRPCWFRSGRCYGAQHAVVDALQHAGYSYDGPQNDGWEMLRRIGIESGGKFHIYNFGWF